MALAGAVMILAEASPGVAITRDAVSAKSGLLSTFLLQSDVPRAAAGCCVTAAYQRARPQTSGADFLEFKIPAAMWEPAAASCGAERRLKAAQTSRRRSAYS
jgi:hypothetical protein